MSEALTASFVFTFVASFLVVNSLIFLVLIEARHVLSMVTIVHVGGYISKASQGLEKKQAEIETERRVDG